MRNLFPLFVLLTICNASIKAQDIDAAINTSLEKDEVPIIYPYDGGTHVIFYSDKSLRFFRLNQRFLGEAEGEVSLEKIGAKPVFIELNANRKNIHLFFTRRDSNGLRCLSTNTINKKSKQSNCLPKWEFKTKLLAYASRDDTAYFFSSNEENMIDFYEVADGVKTREHSLEVSPEFYKAWVEHAEKYPQLLKTHMAEDQELAAHKIPFSPIKTYSNERYLHVTIEDGFRTHVIRLKKSIEQMEFFSSQMQFPNNGSLRGSLSNSSIAGKYLFQAVSTQRGVIVQRTHLKSRKIDFTQDYSYRDYIAKGSPIFTMNRGKQGTFKRKEDNVFEYHTDNSNRFLSLSVSSRGDYHHLQVSEIEPLRGFEEWATTPILTSTKGQTKKVNGSTHTFGLAPQHETHFAFLHHTNYKASTISMSLDDNGELVQYGGPQEFELAEANVLFYKMKYSSLFPSHSTTFLIDDRLYYCFYRKNKKQYYFAPLN